MALIIGIWLYGSIGFGLMYTAGRDSEATPKTYWEWFLNAQIGWIWPFIVLVALFGIIRRKVKNG